MQLKLIDNEDLVQVLLPDDQLLKLCDDNDDVMMMMVMCMYLWSVICGEVAGAMLRCGVAADRCAVTVPRPVLAYLSPATSAVQ